MQPAYPYRLREQHLWLSPDRCIYWEEEQSLILSDLHFGKTGHFRKAGIAVPQSVYREDLLRLLCGIQYFRPRQLLVVGDLFHSRENKELALFLKWREDFPDLEIQLIQGNHDILHESWYTQAGIALRQDVLTVGPFSFVHDITDVADVAATERAVAERDAAPARGKVGYYFSGHIHPGIRINGMGKQSLKFPCFYFGPGYAVLPAFGRFTGTVALDPQPESNVFAILPAIERRKREYAGPGAASAGRGTAGRAYGSGTIFQIQ